MNLTLLLIIITSLVFPLYILATYKKVNNRIKTDGRYRLKDYKQTIFIFWLLCLLIIGNSFHEDGLALNFFPTFNIAGIVIAVLIALFIGLQVSQSNVNSESADGIKNNMADIYDYLPKSKKELWWFTILSISAGFCEEVIFRMFLFSFILENTHIFIAFALTNLVFAITHIGSGKKNLVSSFVLGLIFSVIYYFTENIWLPIILHAAIDINAGLLGYKTKKMAGAI